MGSVWVELKVREKRRVEKLKGEWELGLGMERVRSEGRAYEEG